MLCDLNHRLAISEASVGRAFTETMSFCAYFTTRAVSVVEWVGIWPKVRVPKMTADTRRKAETSRTQIQFSFLYSLLQNCDSGASESSVTVVI
jgi:hypothetical protein